jgi:hypothetical protein
MLCVGLALSLTSVAGAGERSRGGSVGREDVRASTQADTSVARPDVNTPVYEEIGPGTVKVTIGDFETFIHADGSVILDEMLGQYESILDWKIAQMTANGAVLVGSDGEKILADNSIVYDSDFVGQSQRVIRNAEDRMKYVAYGQTTVNGIDVVMFPDGVIMSDQEQPINRTVATVYGPDGSPITADGMIQFQD